MSSSFTCGVLLRLALLVFYLVLLTTNVSYAVDVDEVVQVSVDTDGSQVLTHRDKEKVRQTLENNRKKQQKPTPVTTKPIAVGIKIKNPRQYKVDYYWWSGTEEVYQGFIPPKSVTATNSYAGHVFYFTEHQKPDTEFARINVVEHQNLYILPPLDEHDPHYLELLKEKQFVEEYFETNGIPWLAHFPRGPPIHHMWPADYIGQIHTVETNETYWNCIPDEVYVNIHDTEEINKCRSPASTVTLELEVISLKPRAFRIVNSISNAEADLVVKLATAKLRRSRAGNHGGLESNTRTSSNAWIGRKEHLIMDTVYRRTAHLVNISESLLNPGTRGNIVEQMQVVHYTVGQEYTPHHDFGAEGRPHQRYITLLFYLNNQLHSEAGGETNFPKGDGGRGMKVHPGKGSSILFYSLLPDGNADDKSLHAALPIKEGIKWLANFWIWDPHR